MVPTKRKRQRVVAAPPNDRVDELKADDPVLSIKIEGAGAPALDISSDSLFEQMIYPITKEVFASKLFRRKALHIAEGNRNSNRIDRILEEMHSLDPAFLLNETSSENVFVWLKLPNGTIHSLEITDPSQAVALHKAGHATYCRAPPHIEQPMVSNMLQGTQFGCGQYDPSAESSTSLGRGEVEVFMGTQHSSTNKHVTGWHYDFQENFTIQLSGSKRWTLRQGTTQYPLRACTPHYDSPETVESQLRAAHLSEDNHSSSSRSERTFRFGTPESNNDNNNAHGLIERVVLRPGDVLYFPAGMWHKVETLEPGVSINVSLMATNYATITCQALQHLLLTKDRWRETLVGNSDDALHKLETLLQELPEVVRSFATNGGAQAVLPPVLRVPPQFEQQDRDDEEEDISVDEDAIDHDGGDNNQEEDDELADDDAENEEKEEKKQEEVDVVVGEAPIEDNDDEIPAEIHGARIVHVSSFEAPAGWTAPTEVSTDSKLALNPLAWVCKVDDVTRFYDPNTQHPKHYFISVNYAGNEMHEPAVRLVVCDQQHPTDFDSDPSVLGPREQCYLFYGLYVWRPS